MQNPEDASEPSSASSEAAETVAPSGRPADSGSFTRRPPAFLRWPGRPVVFDDERYRAEWEAERDRLEQVVARTTATTNTLRKYEREFAVPRAPEEVAADRITQEIQALLKVSTATAESTESVAKMLQTLHRTTRSGIESAARAQGTVVFLTWVLVALTAVLAWQELEPLREWLLESVGLLRRGA